MKMSKKYWEISCKDCICHTCSQRDNCAMNGCDGGGCTIDEGDVLEYFKYICDDYEEGWND